MDTAKVRTGVLRRDIELIRNGAKTLLFDPAADVYFRVSGKTLEAIAFLARDMSFNEYSTLLKNNGIFLSDDDLLGILSFCRENQLLVPGYGTAVQQMRLREQQQKKNRFARWASAYLFFRLPPWRPGKLFEKIAPVLSFPASGKVVIPLALIALTGFLLVLRDLGRAADTFADTLSWANLVKYFAVILLLKIVHEAAHSFAAVHFNCRVRGIGVGFMVFYPRLYTDTTDSWKLPAKQRFLIDGAGIIAELILGGIAALLWCYLPPGSAGSTCFYIFSVSTISTLLVNGNPLIRYDGYYILSDLTGIENLMIRSGNMVKGVWHSFLLGKNCIPREKHGVFLFIFGCAAMVYRMFLYTSIILVIYHKFFKALAVVLLLLEIWVILLLPLFREMQMIRRLAGRSSRRRAVMLSTAAVAAVFAAILFVPLPWKTVLPGEVVPESRQLVPVPESGFLTAAFSGKPRNVQAGELLVQLESPALEAGLEKMRHTLALDELLFKLAQTDEQLHGESIVAREKVRSDRQGLQELLRRRESLKVSAPGNGVFVPMLPELSKGAYLERGTVLGKVVPTRLAVNGYAAESQIARLKKGMKAAAFLPDRLEGFPCRIVKVENIPAQLENSPLLQVFGGPLAVLQEAELQESRTFKSVHPMYRVELALDRCDLPPDCGRAVQIKVQDSKQLFREIRRFAVALFRREF